MSEEKLLPCPFCGGEARLTYENEMGHGYCIENHLVRCERCGARGGLTSCYWDKGTRDELREKAVEKWNMRAET